MITLDEASHELLRDVEPELARVVELAAQLCDAPFAIVQGRRTQAEQDALYEQGRTKPGLIVTWTRHSKHIEGKAVDFAAVVDGQHSWDEKLFPHIASYFVLASYMLNIPMTWGGSWHTPDWGHMEIK